MVGFIGRASARPILFMRKLLIITIALLAQGCVYWTPYSRRTTSSATVIPNVPMQKWDIKSCGPGALSSVLQHYGDATTMDEWDSTLRKTRGGVMSIDMVLAARAKGFDSRLVTGDQALLDGELKASRPLILMLQVIQTPGVAYDFYHYIVLDGLDPERRLYRAQFGDGRGRWVPYDRLESAWKGGGYATIMIRPRDPLTDQLRAAVRLEEEGKYAEAAARYRSIVEERPDHVVAWTNLGNAESRSGRRAAAEDAFRKAVALDQTSRDALNNLAWLLYEDKRLDEAESLARKAAEMDGPDSWVIADTLSRILIARGDCTGAMKTLTDALSSAPENAKAEVVKTLSDARQTCP